jgi:hypothetical protein
MMKQSTTRRKVQRRLPRSRIRPKAKRQRSKLRQRLVPSSSQTGPSGFSRIRTEEDVEDYYVRNSTNNPLVFSRTHAQLEEEDPVDEGAEVEGGSG